MHLRESEIYLRDCHFNVCHGVLAQEQTVSQPFVVNLRVAYDVSSAMESDNVADTLNYATLYDLLSREMHQPSALLEHLAGRIGKQIFKTFPQTSEIWLDICKVCPPMHADCAGAGVRVHLINNKKETEAQ